jgi:hypothetical protein
MGRSAQNFVLEVVFTRGSERRCRLQLNRRPEMGFFLSESTIASGGKKIRQIRRFAGSDKKGGRICRENA